jgi:hypothetical protein
MAETFERELSLNNNAWIVGLRREFHDAISLRSENLAFRKRTRCIKDKVVAHGFDLNPVRDPVKISDNLLKILRRHINNRRIVYIRQY